VRLAGRSTGIDVYTPCDDAELAAVAEALRGHALAGRRAEALSCCAAWQVRAAQVAPQWLAQVAQLQERLRDGMPLLPRALDKS